MMFSREVQGAYLGENQVKITTSDVLVEDTGRQVTLPEIVPARYNAQTELVRDVEPGPNRFDFELTSEGEIISDIEDDEDAA